MSTVRDVAILFALREEFTEFRAAMEAASDSTAFTPEVDEKTGRSFFLFEYKPEQGGAYRCITSYVDTMGAQDASYFTGAFIDRYSPRTIVLLGIAGSLSEEVLVGDIVVADQVDDYLQDAKYGEQGFALGGRVYDPDTRLANFARYFPLQHAREWEEIMRLGKAECQASIPESEVAKLRAVVRMEGPMLHVGHIASGPVVGAAESYGAWLHHRDRKLLAIEMEAAGVMNVVHQRGGNQRVLVIRGISDLGDERKSLLDRVAHGGLRRLATRAAVNLLTAFLSAGLLERANPEPAPPGGQETLIEGGMDLRTGPNPALGMRPVEQVSPNPEPHSTPSKALLFKKGFNLPVLGRRRWLVICLAVILPIAAILFWWQSHPTDPTSSTDPAPAPQTPYRIKVVDPEGQAILGAKVTVELRGGLIKNLGGVTDSNGIFSFQWNRSASVQANFVIEATGFLTLRETFPLLDEPMHTVPLNREARK